MSLSNGVRRFLSDRKVTFQILPHTRTESLQQAARLNGVRPEWLVRVVMLGDHRGFLMVILPASHMINFSLLNEALDRNLKPLTQGQADHLFTDCEKGSRPPLPDLFQIPAVIDESVLAGTEVFFEGGSHEGLVAIPSKAFMRLHPDAEVGRFSQPIAELTAHGRASADEWRSLTENFAPTAGQARLESAPEIPSLPEFASKLLTLRDESKTTAEDLIVLLESDQEVAGQVVAWARSPMHGGHDAIRSVQDAIVRGLGFDLVLNLSLGIAVAKALRVPPDGPLGRQTFWRQSVYCAALVYGLARLMPRASRPKTDLAYLAGLTHNFGHLLLAHTFPAEHYLVNQFVARNPNVPVSQVERQVMGVDHEYIGGWLMDAWGMPAAITAAVRWHHNEGYRGDYVTYPNLVRVANRLLRRIHVGDEVQTELPRGLLQQLHLTERLASAVLDGLLANSVTINRLSNRLAA